MNYMTFVALTLFVISAAVAAEDKGGIKAPAAAAATSVATPVVAAAPAALAQKWDVQADKSAITFHGKQMGNDFDGAITKFTPDIHFDADHLDQSKVTVDIDINSIDAKDAERNKNIKESDWFDVARFPTARFETTKISKTGDDAFTAEGNLTIHGITVPIQLPFKLAHEKDKDTVIMTGSVTLDRSKFQLGTGDWADPTVIANEVPVDIKVTATPAAAGEAKQPAPKEAPKDTAKPANP